MFKYLLLLCIVSLAFAFPGSFEISFSRTEIVEDSIPFLADHFQMTKFGSSLELSSQFDAMIRCGFGSSEASVPVLAFDGEGRVWTLEAGVDYLIHPQAPFIARVTAGSAYIMRDYSMGEYYQRYTEGSWESLLSIGLGSEFPVDFIPIINKAEFLLSAGWIGSDVMVVTGEIGIGI
ncbi:MAG: hypothetical protein KAH31_09380 [Candidatus Sabulitectum sp.]|nr:hypothetical protein [Candidatus Sabulitectum sp.]